MNCGSCVDICLYTIIHLLDVLKQDCRSDYDQISEPVNHVEAPPQSPSNPTTVVSTNNNSNLAWELFKLVKYGWYWGRMTRGEAERKLSEQPDGT